MYYEVNVSDKDGHVFATAERSLQSNTHAARVFELLKDKFPESEGYEVTCMRWDVQGEDVTFDSVGGLK